MLHRLDRSSSYYQIRSTSEVYTRRCHSCR